VNWFGIAALTVGLIVLVTSVLPGDDASKVGQMGAGLLLSYFGWFLVSS
jgi:hypothetical protein